MRLPPVSPSEPSGDGAKQPEQPLAYTPASFVYVKIPAITDLVDQGAAREDRIDQALSAKGIGSVQGWGTSMGEARPDGSRAIEFHRIDIDVIDLAAARVVLQQILATLGAPIGTEIHYKNNQMNLQDVYAPGGWVLELPRPPRASSRE